MLIQSVRIHYSIRKDQKGQTMCHKAGYEDEAASLVCLTPDIESRALLSL